MENENKYFDYMKNMVSLIENDEGDHKLYIFKSRNGGVFSDHSYKKSMMTASRVIHQDSDGTLILLKDRKGHPSVGDELTNTEVIELLSGMIVDHLFKKNMKLFNKSKKEEIIYSIVNTLRKELML